MARFKHLSPEKKHKWIYKQFSFSSIMTNIWKKRCKSLSTLSQKSATVAEFGDCRRQAIHNDPQHHGLRTFYATNLAIPQCRGNWLNVIAALIGRVRLWSSGKIEVVSICLRSAARCRRRRCGVCLTLVHPAPRWVHWATR